MIKAQIIKAGLKNPLKKVAAKKVAAKKTHKLGPIKSTGKIVFRADAKQTATLVKVGRSGAASAIRASKALGLPITYMVRGVVIQELPNGVKMVVTTVTKPVMNKPVISLKKGMIFHAKK